MTRISGWLLLLLFLLPGPAHADVQKLRVGIFERPPFASKDADGHWDGLAVAVWERISAELSLPFEYVETSPDHAIADTAAGRLDVLVGEMAISTDRAKLVTFSQPYVISPAAVALLRSKKFPHWLDFLGDVLAHGVTTMLAILAVAMVAFSLMLWIVERSVDRTHFGGRPLHGFGSALWFAAVTMTTVGYGDKTPQSVAGKAIVFFWMFFGVVVISVFTGTVASSISISRVQTSIDSATALAHYKNGVQEGSITQSVLSEIGIPATVYPSVSEGLRALEAGRIDSFVGSEATLRYVVHHEFAGRIVLEVVPNTHLSYAFALRPNLPQRDAIDVSLIGQISAPDWKQEAERYTGPAIP